MQFNEACPRAPKLTPLINLFFRVVECWYFRVVFAERPEKALQTQGGWPKVGIQKKWSRKYMEIAIPQFDVLSRKKGNVLARNNASRFWSFLREIFCCKRDDNHISAVVVLCYHKCSIPFRQSLMLCTLICPFLGSFPSKFVFCMPRIC